MGRKTAEIRVFARLSSYNSEQDDSDRKAWALFMANIRELAEQPEFNEIDISVDNYGSY